jgi:hypothetical protein
MPSPYRGKEKGEVSSACSLARVVGGCERSRRARCRCYAVRRALGDEGVHQGDEDALSGPFTSWVVSRERDLPMSKKTSLEPAGVASRGGPCPKRRATIP